MGSNFGDVNKIQEAVNKTVNEIDLNYLRKMQAEMHRCAATCCDDRIGSPETVKRCVDNCNVKLQAAQKFVQNELNNLQDRLQRCYMTCNDNVRDKLSVNPSEQEIEKYTREIELCAKNCTETHIGLISHILRRTKEAFAKKEFQTSYS